MIVKNRYVTCDHESETKQRARECDSKIPKTNIYCFSIGVISERQYDRMVTKMAEKRIEIETNSIYYGDD